MSENEQLAADLLNFLREQIRWVADFPQQARIRMEHGIQSIMFEVSLDARDTGKFIGRYGAVVDSIRTLLTAYGRKRGVNVYLQVLENRRRPVDHAAANTSAA